MPMTGSQTSDRVARQTPPLRPAERSPERHDGSTLVNRNVIVERRRTSLRLEPAMWDALAEICRCEEISLHDLCTLIDRRRHASSLTAAIRVFILAYFRAAATEDGHAAVGHGTLYRVALDAGRRAASGVRAG